MAVSPHTRTLGFLFADLRGYTDYIDSRGDAAAAELVRSYRSIARTAIKRHDGTEITTEGDSFFVVFDSVAAAVKCGAEILRTTGASDPPIRLGVGIHAGEAAAGADGYVAGPVNLAARLCALAHAGEILVSDTVRALTKSVVEMHYESAGTKRIKGFEEPVSVWRIEVEGAAQAADRGLPPRWLLPVLLGSLVPSLANVAYQSVLLVTNGNFLGRPIGEQIPTAITPILLGVPVCYEIGNLAAVAAVAVRSRSWARVSVTALTLSALLTAGVVPVYLYFALTMSQPSFSGLLLVVVTAIVCAAFVALSIGLCQRRPWVLGIGYGVCAFFAIAVSGLPLAIAAATALRERRENALY